jgi:hypothetical protein
MTRCSIAAGSLLLLFIATSAAPGFAQARSGGERSYPIPKTLTLRDATQPIWIDASVAVTENGEPNPAVWGEYTGLIREYLEKPAGGGCKAVGPAYTATPYPPPRATLQDAVRHSEVALLGRVTDKAYGFYGHDPGQLLQIAPVLSYGYPLSQPRYYFFVPIARFRVGEIELCKTDPRYAEPPDVGDEVFLFVQRPADTTGVLLHVLNPGDVVPVGAAESLRLPRQYAEGDEKAAPRAAAALTKAALLAQIETVRAKGVRP